MEVLKHAEWSVARPKAYHYRRREEEIDGQTTPLGDRMWAVPLAGLWA